MNKLLACILYLQFELFLDFLVCGQWHVDKEWQKRYREDNARGERGVKGEKEWCVGAGEKKDSESSGNVYGRLVCHFSENKDVEGGKRGVGDESE